MTNVHVSMQLDNDSWKIFALLTDNQSEMNSNIITVYNFPIRIHNIIQTINENLHLISTKKCIFGMECGALGLFDSAVLAPLQK